MTDMMNVVSPCMTWVPIIWGQLVGLFIKNRAVGNRVHDLRAVDDPLPDLAVVDVALPDFQAVGDPLPNFPAFTDSTFPHLLVGDDHLSDLPAVDNPLPDLPYHIITDILSRLPAKCVFQCQSVSRLLHILTTTPFFIQTHLNRSSSIMALQSFTQSSDRDIKLYFVEEKAEKIEATSMKLDFCYMCRNEPIMLFGSCHGFLLFRNKTMWTDIFFMCNPTTKQQVTVTSPCSDIYVCGFYFHHLKREYELLCLYRHGAQLEFRILNLGTKSWTNIGNWSYPPSRVRPPVVINGTLHWMVDQVLYYCLNKIYPSCSHSIVSFNIESKGFGTLRHGGPLCLSHYKHSNMQLLEMEGQLGLCYTYSSTELILWILNQATNCWVQRHIVRLLGYDLPKYFSILPNRFSVEVIQIMNGEFFFRQGNRLLAYNLKEGSYRIIVKKGFEEDNFRAMSHTQSLVSLDTESVISL